MSNNNNPITEISLLVVSSLFIIAGGLLLYFGKIDFTGATLIFGLVAGLYGVNGAFKASSPAQQAQISNQQESLQQIIQQLTTTILPALFNHTHPANQAQNSLQSLSNIGGNPPPASTPIQVAPPTPTPAVPQTQFVPNPMAAVATQAEIPAVQPGTQP